MYFHRTRRKGIETVVLLLDCVSNDQREPETCDQAIDRGSRETISSIRSSVEQIRGENDNDKGSARENS
jgi:hypothetical protein